MQRRVKPHPVGVALRRAFRFVVLYLVVAALATPLQQAWANLQDDSAVIAEKPVGGADWESAPALREGWRQDYTRPAPVMLDASAEVRAKLGMLLFFDPVLSGARTMACASCHQPANAWSDKKENAVGENGLSMRVRSPSLENVALADRLGWDGKFPSLESVTFRAISGKNNMDLAEAEALGRLQGSPAYNRLFQQAFGTTLITKEKVEQALAVFERGLVSGVAPFDRWVAGDETAVGVAAKRGFAVFDGKGECSACHAGWAFSDHSFQDIGFASGNDRGRGMYFPKSVALQYAFKVPTLRNVLVHAPFMHDGSKASALSVIDHYDGGGIDRPGRSHHIHPLNLTARDKSDLISFLASLTSDRQNFPVPLLPR